jgi:hypothetical protein
MTPLREENTTAKTQKPSSSFGRVKITAPVMIGPFVDQGR